MKIRRSSAVWFTAFHLCIALAMLLFPFFLIGAKAVFSLIPVCMVHDFLHVYCPLCGGTRAVEALFRWQWADAIRYHAVVVVTVGIGAIWYIRAWIRLFRGKPLIAPIPKWLSVLLLIAFIGYWILRNILLLFFHIDPIGDLVGFWN